MTITFFASAGVPDQNAFASNNYGLSSAVSMLLFVVIILFSILTNRSLRED